MGAKVDKGRMDEDGYRPSSNAVSTLAQATAAGKRRKSRSGLRALGMAIAILASAFSGAWAQDTSCMGLRNPLHLADYTSPTSGMYSGKSGARPRGMSNCVTRQMATDFRYDYPSSMMDSVLDSASLRGSTTSCLRQPGHQYHFHIVRANDGPGTGDSIGKDQMTDYVLKYVPEGFEQSIRIGNCHYSRQQSGLYYTFTVNNNNRLIAVHYAIVTQAPGHGRSMDPEFIIRITRYNSITNTFSPISDTLCYVVNSTALTEDQNGWHVTDQNVWYRDWNKCVINLEKYMFEQVRIEIIMGDCEGGLHYGYCYIAASCEKAAVSAEACMSGQNEAVARMGVSEGMWHYDWYRSRTGVLEGANRDIEDYYLPVYDSNDSILYIRPEHFIGFGGDTLGMNTFRCVMTSYMDPAKPVLTPVTADIAFRKPVLRVDSLLACDGSIRLTDRSYVPYAQSPSDSVDTSRTQWYFYASDTLREDALLGTARGGTATHTFAEGGHYWVRVLSTAYDTTCWTERIVPIRIMKTPTPVLLISRDLVCSGDTVMLADETENATWRRWKLEMPQGTQASSEQSLMRTISRNTPVELTTRTDDFFVYDTNHDGTKDTLRCPATTDTTIRVVGYEGLRFWGDTLSCRGSMAVLHVECGMAGCRYDWYQSRYDATPLAANTQTLSVRPSEDTYYNVKITSPQGCIVWDGVWVKIMDPEIHLTDDKICPGENTTLWATGTNDVQWHSTPNDASLSGQETRDTVTVTPDRTTKYSVTTHGPSGCVATSPAREVKVIPYPEQGVKVLPRFVDTENPLVHLEDTSRYGTSSLWEFDNGTSTMNPVVWTFTQLDADSVPVALTTANALGCTSDTLFWIPVKTFALWFPNAITPTESTNAFFKPITANRVDDYELYIYDRGGDLVFHTRDLEEAWDGSLKGRPCRQGTYVWKVFYKRDGERQEHSRVGTVTLIR